MNSITFFIFTNAIKDNKNDTTDLQRFSKNIIIKKFMFNTIIIIKNYENINSCKLRDTSLKLDGLSLLTKF